MDKLTKERRSWNMSKIKSKDTNPELKVRKILYKLGYRFRLHRKDLPGKPDIVLPKYKTVIFVNGCFWHRHNNCIEASRPKTNSEYWESKITKTVERDLKKHQILRDEGWKVIVFWECELDSSKDENISIIIRRLNENGI